MTYCTHSMPLLLLSVLFSCAKVANAGGNQSSMISKSSNSPNMMIISANESNGVWLFDGRNLPILKTSMTNENIITIANSSNSKSLNLVIPSFEFTVIAKNNFLFRQPIKVDEANSGKKLLWVEPMSTLSIAFRNDLGDTPLQAIVSVTKNTKKVLAIFGPDQGGKFKLSSSAEPGVKTVYSDFGFIEQNDLAAKDSNVEDFDRIKSRGLSGNQLVVVKSGLVGRHIKLSKPVFVPHKNDEIGGSKFWTNNLFLSPNEELQFIPALRTTVIGAK